MPAAPTSDNGVPRTELQELQVKSQQVTDEVINSHKTCISGGKQYNLITNELLSFYFSHWKVRDACWRYVKR